VKFDYLSVARATCAAGAAVVRPCRRTCAECHDASATHKAIRASSRARRDGHVSDRASRRRGTPTSTRIPAFPRRRSRPAGRPRQRPAETRDDQSPRVGSTSESAQASSTVSRRTRQALVAHTTIRIRILDSQDCPNVARLAHAFLSETPGLLRPDGCDSTGASHGGPRYDVRHDYPREPP